MKRKCTASDNNNINNTMILITWYNKQEKVAFPSLYKYGIKFLLATNDKTRNTCHAETAKCTKSIWNLYKVNIRLHKRWQWQSIKFSSLTVTKTVKCCKWSSKNICNGHTLPIKSLWWKARVYGRVIGKLQQFANQVIILLFKKCVWDCRSTHYKQLLEQL